MFIAEGDLVVRRALEAGCKPDVVLCDPKCAHEFAESVHQAGGTGAFSCDASIWIVASGEAPIGPASEMFAMPVR